MVDFHDNRIETIHEINAVSRHAVVTVSALTTWPAVTTIEGFEVQEHLFSAALNPVPTTMGIL